MVKSGVLCITTHESLEKGRVIPSVSCNILCSVCEFFASYFLQGRLPYFEWLILSFCLIFSDGISAGLFLIPRGHSTFFTTMNRR